LILLKWLNIISKMNQMSDKSEKVKMVLKESDQIIILNGMMIHSLNLLN